MKNKIVKALVRGGAAGLAITAGLSPMTCITAFAAESEEGGEENTDASNADQQQEIMTAAEDYSDMDVTVTGEAGTTEADEQTAEDVRAFLDSQNVAADFAVYADELGKNPGHIDGNIAVNTLSENTVIMNKETYGSPDGSGDPELTEKYAEDNYSYVGETVNGAAITQTNGCNQTDENGNCGSMLLVTDQVALPNEEDGRANHFQKEVIAGDCIQDGKIDPDTAAALKAADDRFHDVEDVVNISDNLDEMAAAGQKVIDDTKNKSITDGEQLRDTVLLLVDDVKDPTNKADEIISVTLNGRALQTDDCNIINPVNENLWKLVDQNEAGNRILFNINMDEVTDDEYRIDRFSINRGSNYSTRANNLFWNFGDFAKKITFGEEWSGVVIAPNAELHLAGGIHAGRVIGRVVTTEAGREIHLSTADHLTPVDPTPDTPKEPDKPIVPETPPDVPNKPEEPENPPVTPDKPDTPPEIPDQPDEPDTPPEIPDQPDVPDAPPEVPDKPDVPETPPEIPDQPAVPDTPPNVPGQPEIQYEIREAPDEGRVLDVTREIAPAPDKTEEVPNEKVVYGEHRRNAATGDESHPILYGVVGALATQLLIGWIAFALRKKFGKD